MKSVRFILVLTSLSFVFIGCNNGQKKDTTRRGKKTMYADESYQPLMETASYTFMGNYPESELTFVYSSETDAMNAMAKGLTRTIFVSREFTAEEKKKLHAANITVTSDILARDAVTFIVNNSSVDTLFTQEQLKAMLTEKDPSGPISKKPIEFVFDKVQSSCFNYLLHWLDGKKYGNMVHASKNTQEVIDYVSKHPNAIGIIGYNHLSDYDDPNVKQRLSKIKIVSIQAKDGFYWKPNRPNIIEKKYPFCKELWSINSGSPDGLNSGFVNFLNSRAGQLLMEKCELGSGRGTPREINFTTE